MDSPVERYSRENGVRMSMLGEDLVVGFRGTSTVRLGLGLELGLRLGLGFGLGFGLGWDVHNAP